VLKLDIEPYTELFAVEWRARPVDPDPLADLVGSAAENWACATARGSLRSHGFESPAPPSVAAGSTARTGHGATSKKALADAAHERPAD
jgi:hypothetical protein